MIDLKEVKHIAQLARIDFSKIELEVLKKELSSILDYFNKLKKVDIENPEPPMDSIGLENITREDKSTKKCLQTSEKLLKLAPQTRKRFIKVKPVL